MLSERGRGFKAGRSVVAKEVGINCAGSSAQTVGGWSSKEVTIGRFATESLGSKGWNREAGGSGEKCYG